MRFLFCTILCMSAMTAAGCGRSGGVETAGVSGTVTLDGSPVEGVEVFFFTDKFEGYGKTDESGQYRLINGAAVGNNKVFMKMAFGSDGASAGEIDTSIPGMDDRQLQAMNEGHAKKNKKNRPAIPPEYGDPAKTKLSFPVPAEGTDTADFSL